MILLPSQDGGKTFSAWQLIKCGQYISKYQENNGLTWKTIYCSDSTCLGKGEIALFYT